MLLSTLLISLILTAHERVLGASLPQLVARQDSTSEPTCSGKAAGTTFTYTASSGIAFDVICDEDYAGGDLKALSTASFKECLAACEAESACVTLAYRDGACYLKSQITSAVSNSGVWSAKREIVPTSTTLSCVNNLSDGATYTASKGQFKIICGKEYPGGDLTSTSTFTFEGCIEVCAQNTQCIDVSYVNGACYLKSTLTTLSDVGYAWTAQLIGAQSSVSSPSATPTGTAALTCAGNADNGKSYTTTSGKSFTIECGIDHAGGDLTSLDSTTFETCMDACAASDACVDVSWVYGTCYLKNAVNEGVALAHVWTGRLVKAQSSSEALTVSSSTSSSASSTVTASSTTLSTTTLASSSTDTSTVISSSTSGSTTSLQSSSTSVTPTITSSTPSITPSSASSSASSSAPSSTSSSSTISSSTTSASAPVETFCLKIATPGYKMSGKFLTQISSAANMVVGYAYNVVLYKLDTSGRLYIANGNIVSPVLNNQARVVVRQYTPATVAANPANYPPVYCSITADQTLDCSVTSGSFTYKYWTSPSNADASAVQWSTSNAPVSSAIFYDLAVVPVESCPTTG